MALTTARLHLPYPERPDTADVPRDVEALAEGIDIAVVGYSGPFASRPAAGVPFRIWRATDKADDDPDHLTMDTGTAWIGVAFNMTIPDRSLSHIKLILNTITLAEMGPNSVSGAQILAGAVDSSRLADGAGTYVKLGDNVKPSAGATDSVEALRKLGTGTGMAAKGTHASQHVPGAADPLPITMFYPTYTTVLPTTGLFDAKEVYYAADTSKNIIWHLRYKQSINAWEFVGGNPLIAEVDPVASTGSLTYVDLGGPSITLAYAGDYLIYFGTHTTMVGPGDAWLSFSVGATAAIDADATHTNRTSSLVRSRRKVSIGAGAAIVLKYRTDAGSTTCTYDNRWLYITPMKIAGP